MSELNCYLATFNCGRKLVDLNFFAAHFFDGLDTNLPPDLVVLSLQEIAPLGHSFIGGSLLTPYLQRITTAVQSATLQRFEVENAYVKLLVRNVGMTAIVILAQPKVANHVLRIETSGVGLGVWEMGNKGAVGARVTLDSSSGGEEGVVLTFVAAHLAPMEWDWERRNQDWKAICEGLVFEKDPTSRGRKIAGDEPEAEPLVSSSSGEGRSEQHGLFSPISQVFVAGDLNYRTSDTAPGTFAWKTWPSPNDEHSTGRAFGDLKLGDQLTRELGKGKTLHNLAESEITFPPTYKYSPEAQRATTSGGLEQLDSGKDRLSSWAKHRVPSWCDRILYLAKAPPNVQSYTALPIQPTGDHRPVVLAFSIPLMALDLSDGEVKPPFAIRKDWREARAAARRYELVVGVAAYLALTWEGEALLAGSIVGVLGGYLALRAILGS